jgi:hypothetical protein
LRLIGNIAAGNANQTQKLIDLGLLSQLKKTIFNPKKTIRKETAWILSNIAAGTQKQIEILISEDFLIIFQKIIEFDDPDVMKECIWAMANLTNVKNPILMKKILEQGILSTMNNCLMFDDAKNLAVNLEALGNLLLFGKNNTIDDVNPVVKEMEKMFQEVYSLRRELSDIQNLNKDLINQNQLDKFEEKVNEKITDVKTIFSKRYLDKVEHYKAVKNLESQIKLQVDDNKKDADSWLMAKRPLKCFNCATCESNIKNITPSNEYLAWNKYPAGDRIYRMGQGFSHMLQMMTTEFVKSIEKNANEIQNENEQNYKNLNLNSISDNGRINTHSYANSEKTLIGLSVNNKPQYFEEQQILRKKSGKVRLPLMSKFIKSGKKVRNSDIPVSDEEGENNDLFDKNRLFGSPKILKIMKKKNANILSVNTLSDNINLNTEVNNNPEKP